MLSESRSSGTVDAVFYKITSLAVDLANNLSAKGIDVTVTDMRGIAQVLPHVCYYYTTYTIL